MSDKDFIGKIFPQSQGESLLVLEKTNEQEFGNRGEFLFRCVFQKYPYEIKTRKSLVLRGFLLNPRIEEEEFIKILWKQKCGDTLKILEKAENGKWLCEFQKYKYKVKATKGHIKDGCVVNPEIERIEFVEKIWPQHCGDSLRILEIKDCKTVICQFINNPCKITCSKAEIINGEVTNPQIEIKEFTSKLWPQNCGDTLKILKKIYRKREKYDWNEAYFICEFINYPCRVEALKGEIKLGKIDNPNLPWKKKSTLEKFLKKYKKKPTYVQLAKDLNIAVSTVTIQINKFKLKKYVDIVTTQGEGEIEEFLKEYNIKYEKFCQILKTRELDFYIETKKLGIEFNGDYWHSNLYKERNYHQEKSLFAKENGIEIFHIFEYELRDKKEIILDILLSKLGIYKEKIQARKCEIREIKKYKEYAQFCNENHLQGECAARVKLGLYYNNELVQVMSFGSPRFTGNYQWEIIRECSKLGYIVIGGKEKLWKYFLKKYNPNNIISYCDFGKFTGESYIRLGFKQIRLNKPGFVWWDSKEKVIYLRTPWKHQEMKEKKYLQIYDAGQLVFEWIKK